jgi:AcrR family transcriptional regulator
MSVKRKAGKTGRPVKVPGEKGTKEKIFDAAVAMFSEKGYDGVSVRDIARAVSITESAVYRHYASKDAILESIFTYIEGRIYPQAPDESIDAMVEALSLQEILESIPGFMIADQHLAKATRIMLIEMYHNEKIGDYVRRELFERPIDESEILFRKLIEKGKIKPCEPRAVSTLFISLLVSWYIQALILDYGESPDLEHMKTMARDQVRLFVETFGPESAQPASKHRKGRSAEK